MPPPLTDAACRNAKPREKSYKLAAGGSLYLEVFPNGAKRWRWKYRFAGKENRLGLGVYPSVSLKQARAGRDEARLLLDQGINPSLHRRRQKIDHQIRAAASLASIATEWLGQQEQRWTPRHVAKVRRRFELHVFPSLGHLAVTDITAPDLLVTIRRIEGTGHLETAHRALQNCGQVFRYAIATGRAEHDVSAALKGALKPFQVRHHPSVKSPRAIGALLRAIDVYQGDFTTRCALQLAPLVFVRPGELRKAQWQEIDLERGEWRIPAERMKMRAPHVVPLSRQARAVLAELAALTGRYSYLFPSLRTPDRPMSENTLNAALRRMGYTKDEMTSHGFRSMASTCLNEMGWNRDAIERQLAHAERNSVRAAYNHAEHLPERRKMMQAWADYLDTLRDQGSET